jgi:single-stranded-DNA-specific exonuclease
VSGATLSLIADLERAGPYGAGNSEPVFVLPDVMVAYADTVGTNHLRLRLAARDGAEIGAITFRSANTELGEQLLKSRGRRLHVAGKLKRDDYGGTSRVQLHLDDAAPAGA